MIKGSICPLKRRVIFATNFTEVFVPKKNARVEIGAVHKRIIQFTEKDKKKHATLQCNFLIAISLNG